MFISKLGWRILVIFIKLICNQKFCELFFYSSILYYKKEINISITIAYCSFSGLIEKFHSEGFENITRHWMKCHFLKKLDQWIHK